jgi:hypothetical protein
MSEYSIYLTRKRLINNRKNKVGEPFGLFVHLDESKEKILNSGFFKKDLKIKRK